MANILSSLPSIIGNATKSIRYAITLSKKVISADPDTPWISDSSVTTDHACEGLVVDYNARMFDGKTIMAGDRQVIIFATTLVALPTSPVTPAPIPEPGDTVTAQGGKYTVITVQRDPASATYTCQVRRS